MKHKSITVAAAALAVGVVMAGGLFAGSAFATAVVTPAPKGLAAANGEATTPIPKPHYKTNANGQTYGSAALAPSPADEPELVSVVATNGKLGFALKKDLEAAEGTGFKSPEEAIAFQAAHAGVTSHITVYDAEGTTQIGEFLIVGSE